jgi:hypothetical protein
LKNNSDLSFKGNNNGNEIIVKTHTMEHGYSENKQDVSTLKVKTEKGFVIILKLNFDDTIKTVRNYLDPYLR